MAAIQQVGDKESHIVVSVADVVEMVVVAVVGMDRAAAASAVETKADSAAASVVVETVGTA